jgi:predicted dehydrogenase
LVEQADADAAQYKKGMTTDVRVGVAGLGYWGPNLARNLSLLPGCTLAWCCDPSAAARERIAPLYPQTRFTGDFAELLTDPGLDAVVLATPVPTHADLAEAVMAAGKHCFVEKPLAHTVADAERMTAAAREHDRLLMVGHIFEHHPGLAVLKEIMDRGDLGETYYIQSTRVNLGQVRTDENALWSLGAHDVAMVLRLVGEMPCEVAAHGASYLQAGVEDTVYAFLRFPSGITAQLHLSWLDPHKERILRVVGSRRMATFDAMATERQVSVYDKGFDRDPHALGSYVTRFGDVWSPSVPRVEALRRECEHFVHCLRTGETPLTDGESGLRVVRVLEALQTSLRAPAGLQTLVLD